MVSSRLWHNRPKHIYSKDEGGFLAGLFKTEKVYATTGTFYPDADPETSTVDGDVRRWYGDGEDWESIRNAVSGDSLDDTSSTDVYTAYLSTRPDSDLWYILGRAFFLFDLTTLPAGAVISNSNFIVNSDSNTNTFSSSPSVHVVSSNPISNTGLALDDYSRVGSTSFGYEESLGEHSI